MSGLTAMHPRRLHIEPRLDRMTPNTCDSEAACDAPGLAVGEIFFQTVAGHFESYGCCFHTVVFVHLLFLLYQ